MANKREITAVVNRAMVGPMPEGNAAALDGCAYWGKDGEGKHYVLFADAVAFVRWQALMLNGEWDREMLDEATWALGKHAYIVGIPA